MGFLKSKKFLGLIIGIVLLFILVPLILIFVVNPSKQKTTGNVTEKTQTAILTANTELATFNGTPILVSDLNSLSLEQYGTNNAKNLNPTNIDNLLNIYVERKILDKQNLGDVSAQAAQIEKTSGINAVQAKYEALKDKFTATSPKSWNAYSIGFWLPPTNADGSITKDAAPADPSQTNADRLKLLADVNNALDYAKTQMQKGTSVFNIASQITKNYPTLSALLGINGLIFANSTDVSLWNNPAVYYYNKTNANDPFYKTLYAMTNTSPTTKVLNNDNMGGSVIKIVKVNNPNGILDNYQDWLKNQEFSLKFTNDSILKLENAR